MSEREYLAFGLNEGLPEDVKVAWGARLIFPDDLVHNRQSVIGKAYREEADLLCIWLDGKAIRLALKAAREMANKGAIRPESDETVVLYEDNDGVIKGNPNASHGYLYVVGYLKPRDLTPCASSSYWTGNKKKEE